MSPKSFGPQMRSISTSRVSTRPAFESSSSSNSNSFSGERDQVVANEHLVPGDVEADVADLELLGVVGDDIVVGRAPAETGPHPGHQLAEPERLRHVVVGADLETDHRVDLRRCGPSP